jgi:hypothetical protein
MNYKRAMLKMQALGRLPKGTMNKTEAAWAEHLEVLKRVGEIQWYRWNPGSLKLTVNGGPSVRFEPDFFVLAKDSVLEVHEVKGFMTDDANVKNKLVADQYPFRFKVIRRKGGSWIVEEVGNE